jgi:pimeloyl-ACP methyl ester carboxylesterase
MAVEKRDVEVEGLPIRYLTAGSGPPLVLLHGAGDNSLDWRWVISDLAATHRVYAPDLPGSPDSARPAVDYSPAFFERFLAAFVDALDMGRATFVGNSLGGLIALRLALSEPTRVTALVLVDSAGLGREVNPAFTTVNVPGLGEAAIPFWRTPPGAYQRAWGRTALLFAHAPGSVPRAATCPTLSVPTASWQPSIRFSVDERIANGCRSEEAQHYPWRPWQRLEEISLSHSCK